MDKLQSESEQQQRNHHQHQQHQQAAHMVMGMNVSGPGRKAGKGKPHSSPSATANTMDTLQLQGIKRSLSSSRQPTVAMGNMSQALKVTTMQHGVTPVNLQNKRSSQEEVNLRAQQLKMMSEKGSEFDPLFVLAYMSDLVLSLFSDK